ncbi:O-antigen ligase family protein [Sporosarcina saromensis]|uniref:O-antigen ligase family protein n=1 Tax=Sporosarcina saromensis TaxID=359365 RepID=A0ABU4GAL2_9BACL|nr:O-antigen ligase family protein [Sporosarcina saromensis]MDW0114036.1 O-antigen ligase family protein [Sporosarcina saromensis]
MNLLKNDFAWLFITLAMVAFGLIVNITTIGLIIVVFLAVLTFFRKDLGLYMLLVYIPIRPFLTALNPGFKLIGDLIIFALIAKTIYENRKNLKTLVHFEKLEVAYMSFLVIGSVSALINGVSLNAIIFQLRTYVLFFLIYYVVKRMEISVKQLKKGAMITFCTAIILSLQGFVEKISDKTMLMPTEWQNWTLSPTNHVRVYGLLKGPNEFGLYLIIAFFISLFLMKVVPKSKRWIIFAGSSIIAAAFLLTYSRGSLIALVIFALIYLVVYRSLNGLKKVIGIAATSVIIYFAITYASDLYINTVINNPETDLEQSIDDEGKKNNETNSTGINRYKEAFTGDTIQLSSETGRIYYVKKSIEVFKAYPIIGAGFGTFGGAATLAYSSPIYDHFSIKTNFYSDNQYILVLAETGIVGVITLAVFVISLLLLTIQYIKRYKKSPIPIFLLYFLTTLVVGAAFYNILENDTFMLYYFLLLAIAYGNKHLLDKGFE